MLQSKRLQRAGQDLATKQQRGLAAEWVRFEELKTKVGFLP